ESTTVAEIAIAITNPATPTDPVLSNGTDKGIRAPRMPALEAKAEVKAAVAQTSNAPNNGVRRPATLLPTIVMVPVLCSSAMEVTVPQINMTGLQLTLLHGPLLVDGDNKCSNTPQAMASIPRSTRKTSAPTAT